MRDKSQQILNGFSSYTMRETKAEVPLSSSTRNGPFQSTVCLGRLFWLFSWVSFIKTIFYLQQSSSLYRHDSIVVLLHWLRRCQLLHCHAHEWAAKSTAKADASVMHPRCASAMFLVEQEYAKKELRYELNVARRLWRRPTNKEAAWQRKWAWRRAAQQTNK